MNFRACSWYTLFTVSTWGGLSKQRPLSVRLPNACAKNISLIAWFCLLFFLCEICTHLPMLILRKICKGRQHYSLESNLKFFTRCKRTQFSVVRKYRNNAMASVYQRSIHFWSLSVLQKSARHAKEKLNCTHFRFTANFYLSLLFHMGIHVVVVLLSRGFHLIENLYHIFSESQYAQKQSGHFCPSVAPSSSCKVSS